MISAAALSEPGWDLRAVEPSSIANITIVAGFLDRIPPELRMEIYKLVLPTDTFFVEGWGSSWVPLLTTCKTINREASPIFYSSNNFQIGHHTTALYPPTHALFKHAREVTFDLSSPNASVNAEEGADDTALNAALLQDLGSYPSLETLHIRGYWFGVDREYRNFEHNYQKEGVIPSYLEHTGLNAFLGLSRIHEITLHHVGIPPTQTKDLEAMGKYMTKYLKDRKSSALDV